MAQSAKATIIRPPSTLKSVPLWVINSKTAQYVRYFPGLNFSYFKLNLIISLMTEAT